MELKAAPKLPLSNNLHLLSPEAATMRFPLNVTLLLVELLFGSLTAPVSAQSKKITPSDKYEGSVADEDLVKLAPKDGLITSGNVFQELWKKWEPAKKAPEVDFKKNLLLVATTRGSKLNMLPALSADGNLKVPVMATKDLKPGFRYQIYVIPREGIVTINGKPLPE
jgi:hypothetical protein